MQLTAENVTQTFRECLYKHGEDTTNSVIGDSYYCRVGFHPERLEAKKADIVQMVRQLPTRFIEGDSFLNACVTQSGEQWGEHIHVDQLMALGTATGTLTLCAKRELWPSLPGGMPYLIITP